MTLTSLLFKAARASATGRAVTSGRASKRAVNIGIGRLAGRGLGKLWR